MHCCSLLFIVVHWCSLLLRAAICKSKDIENKHKIQTIIEHHKNENEGNTPHEGSP